MTPYARREISWTLAIGGLVSLLVGLHFGWLAVLPAVLTLALLGFYRDPARQPPADACAILAPADGKIVEISRDVAGADDTRLLRLMVFLSVLDVHVNRSPCAGRVREVSYRPGEFLNALRADADTRNESNTLVIEPAAPLPGPVRVRQIAGVLARRIVCAVQAGHPLSAGQRFGMIKLGSRTEVCLPDSPDWEICVRLGQHVKAGLTVLARLRAESLAPAVAGVAPEELQAGQAREAPWSS